MPQPLVSIIIPTRNREALVATAIDSVLNQTQQDFELIVVDDGSTDATPEVLRAYGNRIACLRIDPAGPSAARNRGIAAAQTGTTARPLFIESRCSGQSNPGSVDTQRCARECTHKTPHALRLDI
jgi:GT2 family glycosyltransferase